MLFESFVNNTIIDLSYNLNKYTQYKLAWKLFEVGCLHQHTAIALPCIAWIGIKSCSKFLRILVAAVYFTDRNWISKTLYSVKYKFFPVSIVKQKID